MEPDIMKKITPKNGNMQEICLSSADAIYKMIDL
jgi:hypothetical protein